MCFAADDGPSIGKAFLGARALELVAAHFRLLGDPSGLGVVQGASSAVSAQLSRVVASPGSAPADGLTQVTVTVDLVDGNGIPLAGKTVQITAAEEASSRVPTTLSTLNQPSSITDSNGQVTATLTSTLAGTAIISARKPACVPPMSPPQKTP